MACRRAADHEGVYEPECPNEGKRKLIYRTSKCICKCYGNLDCTISIVTLPHVHQSWQPADFSQIEIIESELATSKSEDDTIRRCLFHKFCVIVSTWLSPITAGNQEEMADCT